MEIYESIQACARADVTCIRSVHAVTIVCEWPQRWSPSETALIADIFRSSFDCIPRRARSSQDLMSMPVQWDIMDQKSLRVHVRSSPWSLNP
jgi:hypothetical protein